MIKNNKKRAWLAVGITAALIAIFVAVLLIINANSKTLHTKMTLEEAQTFIDKELDKLPNNVASSAKFLRENTDVKVIDVEYGNEKNIILSCTYNTVDIYKTVSENIDSLLDVDTFDEATGTKKNATKIQVELAEKLNALLDKSEHINGEVKIEIYELNDRSLKLHLDDKTVNTFFGGIIDARKLVEETKSITVDGETVDIANKASLRRGLTQCFALINYDASKPDTSVPIIKFFNDIGKQFHINFIEENRWQYLAKGLGTTLSVTALALVLGLVIGFIVAIIRCTYAKTGRLGALDAICRLYLSIMRGTPVMIQLLIIYFVFLLPVGVPKMASAVLCFGINSGAYVSEIVRGGIMSVDNGQMEAGRSLGFNYVATMWYIIIPQAIKAVLPALANEFIALLKETSVAFYIGVADLTMGGLKIRSITYSNFMPLIAIGLIYLVLVLGLSYLVSRLERRMNKSDRG